MSEQSPGASAGPSVVLVGAGELVTRWLRDQLLAAGYGVCPAATGPELLEQARAVRPDAIILESQLGDAAASDLCGRLRADSDIGDAVPILVLASEDLSREARVAAFRAGAWECLARPIDAEELLARLETYVRAKHEMDRSRTGSMLDPLTALYNRQGIARRARELGSQAFRQHAALACVALSPDLADWAPEEAAERCAQILKTAGRSSDAFGRLGPTEFAIVAPGTDGTGAVKLAERLARALERDTDGRGRTPLRLRAGYEAVANFGYEPMDPVALLYRATTALRAAQTDPARTWIHPFRSPA